MARSLTAQAKRCEYRRKNQKRIRAQKQAYYRKNKVRACAASRDWHRKNRARARDNQYRRYRTARGRAVVLAKTAHRVSRLLGTRCDLTTGWLQERIERGVCEVTGIPFVLNARKGHRHPFAPSIDRKKCGGAYTKRNTRVVLSAFNMGRSDWGDKTYATVARAYLKKNRGLHA